MQRRCAARTSWTRGRARSRKRQAGTPRRSRSGRRTGLRSLDVLAERGPQSGEDGKDLLVLVAGALLGVPDDVEHLRRDVRLAVVAQLVPARRFTHVLLLRLEDVVVEAQVIVGGGVQHVDPDRLMVLVHRAE